MKKHFARNVDSPARSRFPVPLSWAAVPALCWLVTAVGCAKIEAPGGMTPGPEGTGGDRGGVVGGSGRGVPVDACTRCTDFNVAPIMETGVPANAADMFGGTPSADPVCIVEPEDDTLFPKNWLRPRVKFTGNNGKLVKITMEAPNQEQVLTAYTMSDTWILPQNIWLGLHEHQIKEYVTVTVRVQGGGSGKVRFRTAPVSAPGNLIFWAANPALVDIDPHLCRPPNALANCANASMLRGFSVGDEKTIPVLNLSQVMQGSRTDSGAASPVICVGCHSGMPDTGFVTFVDHYPWRAVTASVQGANTGAVFTGQTPGGLAALQLPGWGPFTYAKQVWGPGLKIGVASLGLANPAAIDYSNGPDANKMPNLAWVNLESPNPGTVMGNWTSPSYTPGGDIMTGNSVGLIAHTNDLGGATFPDWSHDGETILYASTVGAKSARLEMGKTDLYTVPFNMGSGGVATAVPGAASADREEYYPAYSPDDRLIAFTSVRAGQVMYANPQAEISVIPASGGTPARLRANDPPRCTGKTSPGVNNHWPKWSPDTAGGTEGKYYWIIFSSNRAGIPPVKSQYGPMRTVEISQLYMAPVVMNEFNVPTSYPAIYLWNQPTDSVNTTPAWSTFTIPPVQ
ncbi:MAG: hypothetical protein ABI560_16545 [Myxococcales bacterium]